MYLDDIGNDLGEPPKPRIVESEGLVVSPNLIMKVYSMLPQDESVDVLAAKSFIEQEIQSNRIIPAKSGMGFAIVSENALTSTVWGLGYNMVPNTDVYGHEGDFSLAEKLDINTDGNYCAFEAQILGFESKKWLEFLNSPRTNPDKKQYFDSWLRGQI